MKVVFDPKSLTLGDMFLFKDKTGVSVQDAFTARVKRDPDTGEILKDAKGRPLKSTDMDPGHLIALVWLLKRKENPEFAYEDAFNIPAVELEVESPEEDPKG
ncbi:hypothetical protein [Streptomyces cadmiisoli]|uniref:hypothetical protein n=1 Tax=Streptomyces cadmiisoli TaxID=2184053 RepID=UPI0013A6C787|nr:hypothetical protein [Streptomyces cadmiisoli]